MHASEINSRFHDEINYIERYVAFILSTTELNDKKLKNMNAILNISGIRPTLPTAAGDATGDYSVENEGEELIRCVHEALSNAEGKLAELAELVQQSEPTPLDVGSLPKFFHFNDWVEYFYVQISGRETDEELQRVLAFAISEAERDDERRSFRWKQSVQLSLDHAVHVRRNEALELLQFLVASLNDIGTLARVRTPNSEIDVLRQGFVLLMTAFDAAIFDLAEIAFRRRFFEVIAELGKGERIALEDLGNIGSFERMSQRIVEQQLKKRYLKELLIDLGKLGVRLVEEGQGDKLVHLIELVLRRNLHIHSRGVVDCGYLEANPEGGKPRYNLYNLKIGEHAIISDEYFRRAVHLCMTCIKNVAEWAGREK